jgi:hypothetical protein
VHGDHRGLARGARIHPDRWIERSSSASGCRECRPRASKSSGLGGPVAGRLIRAPTGIQHTAPVPLFPSGTVGGSERFSCHDYAS